MSAAEQSCACASINATACAAARCPPAEGFRFLIGETDEIPTVEPCECACHDSAGRCSECGQAWGTVWGCCDDCDAEESEDGW
jgi:hypothetical protein